MPIETRTFTNTYDSARWPLAARCSAVGCNFAVCCSSFEEGEEILEKHEMNGPCPYDGRGRRKMPVGKSLREKQWELLDEAVDAAVDPESSVQRKHEMNGAAQGIAKCIFLMDTPYWESPLAVMKEAAERLKMRRGEIPKRPTPGCDEPHSVQTIVARTDGMVPTQQKVAPRATQHPLDAKIRALNPTIVTRIIRGSQGGLDVAFLADVNGVDLPLVKRIVAQPDRFANPAG